MEKSKFYSIVEYVAATPRSKRTTGTAAGGGSIIVGSDAGGTGVGEDGGSHAHANWELLERLGEQERYLTLKEENPDYYDLTDMEGRENIFSLSDMEQGTLDALTGVPAESDTCLRSKSFRLVSGGHISVNSFGGRWMFLWLFYDAERTYINTAAEAAWITNFPHVAVLPENAAYVKFLITRGEVAAGEPDDTALTPADAKADCRITVEMTDSPSSSWYPSAADYDPNTAPYLREKIKAGYADKAGIAEMAEDAKKWDGHLFNDYIDQPVRTTDEVRHKAVIGSFRTPDFAGGMTGLGGRIDEQGDGELESLILRRSLTVPEYNFNRVEISVGDDWSAPGGGVIAAVDTAQQLVTLKLEEGEWGAVAVDDICMGIFHSFDTSENASADRDDSRGNRAFAGFATSYFRITEVLGDHHEQFKYELRPVSASHTAQVAPSPAMKFVAYGSFRDASRRTSRYSTRVYQRYLRGVDDWEFKADNIAAQYGDLSNLAVFGLQMAGYSAYLDNIYMQGLLRSLDGTFVIDTKTKSLLMASAVTGVGMVFNPLQGLKIGTVYDPETGRFQKEYDIVQLDQTASNAEQTANEAHQAAEEAARRAQEAKDYIDNTLPEEFAQINRKLDGVVENWFYPYTPTSENEPAASWISGGTQAEHEGDTFTNTQVWVDAATTPDAGKSWRWIKDGTEYKWTLIADSDAVKALQQAAKAQAAADSKIRNFVVTPTPPYEVGDFWSQGAAGEIMRCIKARTSGSFDAADWVAAGDYHAYTDEKVTGKLTVIDASALDQDTYYPVTIYVREKFVRSKIAVRVSLDAPQPSIPAWATHPWGFSCYAIWSVCGSGWGADKENRIIEDFQYSWATKEPIGSIGQLMKSSLEYIYVRGGGVYKFYVTNGQAPKLRTETFTLEGESLELRTSVERPISLQEQADTAKAAANQAFSAVSSLKNFTDTAFADGIVDRAEAAAIEKYINSVKETQDAVKASYTTVYGNSLLAGSAKSNLASAKTAFDTAVTNLLSAISSAISDGVATTAERTAVNDKYALFNTAYGTYTSRLEEAQKYITDQIKAKADAAQAAADAAKAAAEAAKTAADSASSAVASLKDFTDTAFADGIVDRAEAAAIEKYINSVKETQDAVKASYTTVYGNSMLSSTAKSNLRSAKTAFDTAVTNLLTAISDAIKDGKATTAERTAVNDKYALFNTAYGTYTTRLEEAQKYITDQIKAKADAAQAAADAAEAAATNAAQAANAASSAVASLKNFTDKAFADGIVDRAEAAAIEKYINSVKETQDAVKASYTTVYGNSLLAGSAKSNLASAKTAFDTAVTNLLSAISSAISDGVATTAERTAVNDKYALFNTAYGTYTSRLEEAQKYITDQIKARADEAYELSQDLQTAVSRLNDTIIPELQSQLDKQIVSWNGTAVPTLSNAPASDWTTTAERERHLGDYYDRKVTGGYERYKFVYEGNVYKWQLMADSEAAAAQSKAIEALGVAGSKNKVYFGDTTPAAPYAVNDLWVKTSGELYICNKNVQSGGSAADWKLVNDAQLRLRQMSSDSVISKEEKAVLRNTLTQMGEEMAEYYNDVAEYGVDISELEAAYSQLVSFLENTVAVKSDTDTTLTSQNLSVYNALFAAYDVAVSRFAAAVAAAMAAEQVGDVGYLKALFPATAEVDGAVIAQMLAVKNDAGTQVMGFLNGSSKFSDATHGICMIAMGMSSVTGWSSAKTRLYADGYFETSNASITGKITAETGKIGPFEIEVFNLRASTPTDILSLSASRINFSGATCDVFVGTSTYMEIMGAGLVGPVVVKEYRSTSLSYAGNVGICIDVKGAGLNDSYTKSGNHALYITSGTVTGLRLKNRRVSSNLTLDDMDCLVIIDSDAAKRTITLPASPKDGQFYIIRNIGTKGVTLQGNGKQIVLHTQGAWVSSDSWTNRDARYMVYSQIVGAWIMSA